MSAAACKKIICNEASSEAQAVALLELEALDEEWSQVRLDFARASIRHQHGVNAFHGVLDDMYLDGKLKSKGRDRWLAEATAVDERTIEKTDVRQVRAAAEWYWESAKELIA